MELKLNLSFHQLIPRHTLASLNSACSADILFHSVLYCPSWALRDRVIHSTHIGCSTVGYMLLVWILLRGKKVYHKKNKGLELRSLYFKTLFCHLLMERSSRRQSSLNSTSFRLRMGLEDKLHISVKIDVCSTNVHSLHPRGDENRILPSIFVFQGSRT